MAKGDIAKSIEITDWDRTMFLDYMLRGSMHETVMPIRNRIMDGDDDRNPIIKFTALVRASYEDGVDEKWLETRLGDFLCDGDPVAESIRDMLVDGSKTYPMWQCGVAAIQRLKEESDGQEDA